MKKVILIVLIISLIIEVSLTFLCFFMPTKALALFGMQYNQQTAFLGYIIAWFCLLVSAFIIYAIYLFQQNNPYYKPIIYLLSFWWIGLGIGVYVAFGRTDNLLLDSVKAMVLIFLNYSYNINKVNAK